MRLVSIIFASATYFGLFLSEAEGSTSLRGDPNDDYMFEIPDARELGEDANFANTLNVPGQQLPGFLGALRKNLEKRYSHHHHINTMHQKFSKRIAYLEDLIRSRSPTNFDEVVKTILMSLQSEEADKKFREDLSKINTIYTAASDDFRRCLEEHDKLPNLADADFNFVEEMMSKKASRLPPDMALPAIRNLTATMDSQRFYKIANTLQCIFQSAVTILGGTSEKECKANVDVKPLPSYIRQVQENTMKALNTTIMLRTLTGSVDTAMKLYQDALLSIISAIFSNKKPELEVAPEGKAARLYDELIRCLEQETSNAAKCSKFPDADVSQGTTGLPTMKAFAEHVGRMRYLSITFNCHLRVVEQRKTRDQYTHALSDLHVWKWYEEGAYREMDIDTEYETADDEDGHSHSNFNHDHEHGEAFEQVSDMDLELSMHFDQNHRLHVHPHHKGRGPN